MGVVIGGGMGPSGRDLNLSKAYGFSPGIEALWMFGDRIEAGAGFQWQLPRRVFRSDGEIDEVFNFVPIYALVRVNLTRLNPGELHFTAKLGYAVFFDSPGFRNILPAGSGGPLTSSSGGLFGAAAIGVTFIVKDRTRWGLDLSADVGYGYHRALGSSANRSHPIDFQSMMVNFSLDWRF